MKRVVWLVAFCLLLCACAQQPEPVAPTPDTPTPEPTLAPAEEETIVIPTPIPEVVYDVPLPTEDTEEPATPEPLPPLTGLIIGIDPGHQQYADHGEEWVSPDEEETRERCSAGTRGITSNVYEYQVNLDVALKLKALLEAQGAKVILTRNKNDVQISNRERAEVFNRGEVDFAIVLHCNGTDDPAVHGAFAMVPTKQHTAYFSENVRAASAIIERYCISTGLDVRKGNGIAYRDDQTCLNWCERPIICMEMGYLSNEKEDMLLTNAAFQDKMAFGILDGILGYFSPEGNAEGGNG